MMSFCGRLGPARQLSPICFRWLLAKIMSEMNPVFEGPMARQAC